MIMVAYGLLAFVALAAILHGVSVAVTVVRCRRGRSPARGDLEEGVTLLRPVCGLENNLAETLRSSFELGYPRFEIIFCVARANDPAIGLIKDLIETYPWIPSRLLIGENRLNENPKLSNLMKGWHAARHPWIIMADSNVLLPHDYIERLLSAWRPASGLVCAPPIGSKPETLGAELECAFMNGYQARWQYAAAAIGLAFAQGKTMLWRKSLLDAVGGIDVLASELAEDAAATKAVRRSGRSVHLADRPCEQPLGRRSLADMWRRQVRWARLRRTTFPAYYALETLSGIVAPALAWLVAAELLDWPMELALLVPLVWYGVEAALVRLAGWHWRAVSPLAWMARDLALPAIWIAGLAGTGFVWRGNAMALETGARA
jgi:ceramide glucosyltransferase